MISEIELAARRLATANAESEPNLEAVYLFPSDHQIRLVEVDRSMSSSDMILPFYFPPDPEGGIPFPSALALIRPEEERRLSPPDGWGTWDEARRIWPEDE